MEKDQQLRDVSEELRLIKVSLSRKEGNVCLVGCIIYVLSFSTQWSSGTFRTRFRLGLVQGLAVPLAMGLC